MLMGLPNQSLLPLRQFDTCVPERKMRPQPVVPSEMKSLPRASSSGPPKSTDWCDCAAVATLGTIALATNPRAKLTIASQLGAALDRAGVPGKHVLDLVVGQAGVLREHQGDRAGDHRRRLRCSAALDEAVVGSEHRRRPGRVQRATGRRRRHRRDAVLHDLFVHRCPDGVQARNVRARRNQVGVALVRARRTAGVRRHEVVGRIAGRAVVVVPADGDDVVVVGRRVDAGVALRRSLAAVSVSGDDDDAGLPRHLNGVAERVLVPSVGGDETERDVEHLDVQAIVVAVLRHPVDRGDHLGHVGRAHRVGDLQADDT